MQFQLYKPLYEVHTSYSNIGNELYPTRDESCLNGKLQSYCEGRRKQAFLLCIHSPDVSIDDTESELDRRVIPVMKVGKCIFFQETGSGSVINHNR